MYNGTRAVRFHRILNWFIENGITSKISNSQLEELEVVSSNFTTFDNNGHYKVRILERREAGTYGLVLENVAHLPPFEEYNL